jgi:6,7-dimethyl-8-ribityllumazine synthase
VPAPKAPRVAFLVAEFHRSLVDAMLSFATDEAKAQGMKVVHTVRVPGAYETPLVAKKLLARRDVDALVVLGYIERGETLHGEVMGHVVHRVLVEASLAAEKPVGLGIIGPGATKKQAEARKKSSARSAVRAVVKSLEALAKLGA